MGVFVMARRKLNWWQCPKTLKLRLRGYNEQGKRYGFKPIPFDKFEYVLKGRYLHGVSPLFRSCCYCGRALERKGPSGVSFDHTIALSRGGTHGLENMTFCCRTCQRCKGNWSVDFYVKMVEFLAKHGMLKEFFRSFRRRY